MRGSIFTALKEKTMANKKNVLEMLVVILVFGVTVIGFISCSKNVDRRLNGTWEGNGINEFIYKYNSGKFEISNKDGSPFGQGTYTTSDGKITYIPTHIFGTDFGFGFDPRWYSKHDPEFTLLFRLFKPTTDEYIVDDNKISYKNDYETYTKTLVSRDGKFTKAKSKSKKSVPVEKSSGKVSAFPGRWHLIEGRGDAKDVELFKDGTGTADGSGITWKIENGRFHILHPFYTFSAYYNVTGSTITLTKDNGVVVKYQKK